MALGFSLIGAFGTPIVGWFFDLAGGDYTNSFWFGICITIIAAIIIILAQFFGRKVVWDE